jgi:hypothetical protein
MDRNQGQNQRPLVVVILQHDSSFLLTLQPSILKVFKHRCFSTGVYQLMNFLSFIIDLFLLW